MKLKRPEARRGTVYWKCPACDHMIKQGYVDVLEGNLLSIWYKMKIEIRIKGKLKKEVKKLELMAQIAKLCMKNMETWEVK